MEFFKQYKLYIIFGVIFLLGVVLIIAGISSKKEEIVIEEDNPIYYIELSGLQSLTIYQGEDYIEPGYRGYDDNNNDLTNEVVVANNINKDNIGIYRVTYTLNDITKERIVNVIKKEQGATYIHLYGDVNTFLYVGDEYVERGYEVIDTVDGTLKDKVKVVNNVNTMTAGVYKVTYTVTNSSNITTTATRRVIVMNSAMSLSIDNEEYTNSAVKINVFINDNKFNYLILPNGTKVTEKIYSYEVSENGIYEFTMYNMSGSKKETITVNNIDKIPPVGNCSGSHQDGRSIINITASDNIELLYYEIENAKYATNQIVLGKELKTANVNIYDKAGNKTSISCNLEDKNVTGNIRNIDKRYEPKYLIKDHKNVSLNYYVSSHSKGFSYWVYLPEKLSANLPVIMYMPGMGEIGDDYQNNAKGDIANGPIHEVVRYNYKYNAIVVHMQVPSGHYVYEYLPSYVELIDKIATEYQANKKKISVMGFSHGCYGVMNLIPKYQTYFSAAVPIGCDPKDRAKYFVSTPTWAFAGGGDGVSTMPGFATSINNMGGVAKFSRPPYHYHNVIGDAYSILRDDDYKVIEWMTNQTRK